jgi:hypothetical protein
MFTNIVLENSINVEELNNKNQFPSILPLKESETFVYRSVAFASQVWRFGPWWTK